MSPSSLYIRDVPEDIHRILRTRAADEGMSVSPYVLQLLTEETRQPTVAEVFARRRQPIRLTDEEILSAIHKGRH